ncbi:hypothetical protein RUND412_009263 [Rhizina undulata]
MATSNTPKQLPNGQTPSSTSRTFAISTSPPSDAVAAHLNAASNLGFPSPSRSLAGANGINSADDLFESWVEFTSNPNPPLFFDSSSNNANGNIDIDLNLLSLPVQKKAPTVPPLPGEQLQSYSVRDRKTNLDPRVPTATSGGDGENMSVHSGSNHDGENRIAGNGFFPDIPKILPHEKVFPIQIGGELFRLSGASISSDAPSYFSQFFEQQLAGNEENASIRTLYIDRDPVTFRDIARHLQGYHVSPCDGQHFVRLFADAQFYSLPKLISQLFESEIFITIGSKPFRIPRELFLQTPGNHPNFFSLGFAVFFSSPSEVFPGLSREGLLRPPSILPPEVPNRSAEVFTELLHLLQGYPIHIRNEEHRAQLLRDCKYFNLKGLEQKLIPHEITYNPARRISEIVIRLEDIKPSGVTFCSDSANPSESMMGRPMSGWIHYARPFVDDQSTQRELVVEIGHEATRIDFRTSKAEFIGTTLQRITALFQVIANKLGLPVERPLGLVLKQQLAGSAPESPKRIPLSSDDKVKIHIGPECYLKIDGEEFWDREGILSAEEENGDFARGSDAGSVQGSPVPGQWPSQVKGKSLSMAPSQPRKRMRRDDDAAGAAREWMVKRGMWRIRVHTTKKGGLEVVLVGVKIEGFSSEYGRNGQRGFLT